jgi:hypothetical protein
MRGRLFGLILLMVGVAIAYFFIMGPLAEARAGAEEVRFSVQAFVVAPMALITGILLLIGGNSLLELIDGPPESPAQWIVTIGILAVVAIAGLGGYWWFNTVMEKLGYG